MTGRAPYHLPPPTTLTDRLFMDRLLIDRPDPVTGGRCMDFGPRMHQPHIILIRDRPRRT